MPKMLEELVSKTVRILAKAEIIEEKLDSLRSDLRDLERRVGRLEGGFESETHKLRAAFAETKVKLFELGTQTRGNG